MIQELRQEYFPIIPHNTKTNKEERLMMALPKIENGSFLLPKIAPWLTDYENELFKFPSGRYDDQGDATMMILEFLGKNSINKWLRYSINPRDRNNVRAHVIPMGRGYSEYDQIMGNGMNFDNLFPRW